jgi:hypothetical protein
MPYIGNQPQYTSFLTDTFSGNGSTTVFTMSVAPVNTAAVLVALSGVLQNPADYAVVGRILTFSSPPPSGVGNISIRYLALPASNVVSTAYRSVTEFTATAGQTTFTPASYTPGFIDVFRSGVRLGTSNYVATNGVTVTLNNPAAAGDLIAIESFFVSSVLNAIPAVPGQITPALLDSTSQLGTGALLLPSGTTAQRPASPQVGMQRWNTTLQAMEVFVGNGVWQLIASSSYSVEYLLVAGGGGGAYQVGGGGGAGGLISSNFTSVPGATYTITVGAGGNGSPNNVTQGSNGVNSLISSVATAIGGGRGGNHNVPTDQPSIGGSGGGGSGNSASQNVPGAAGTVGQGNAGGRGLASTWAGGGGGGAGAVGGDATANTGGPGGNGRFFTEYSTVGGSPAGWYAGGGGGSMNNQTTAGFFSAGGLGGGGRGLADNGQVQFGINRGDDGIANTGGGGGGVRDTSQPGVAYVRAGNGGSGIVVLRYAGSQRGTGGIVTSSAGFTYHTFTTSGAFIA